MHQMELRRTILICTYLWVIVANAQKTYTNHQYPSWSNNGKRIIFNSDLHGNHDIFIMDSDGKNLSRIYSSPKDDIQPIFFNGDTHVIFSSNQDGDWEIYRLNLIDGHLLKLTDNKVDDRMPALSPLEDKLVFLRGSYDEGTLHILNMATGQEKELTGIIGFNPDWSKEGQIVFDGPGEKGYGIHIIDEAGTNHEQITYSNDFRANWSSDGKMLSFSSVRTGNWECYIMQKNGEHVSQLTYHPSRDFWQRWSPNNQEMVFASSRYGNYDIFKITIEDPSKKTRLTFQKKNDVLGLMVKGKKKAALRKYEKLKERTNPENVIHFGNLMDYGDILRKEKKLSECILAYELAIEVNPKSINALISLGDVFEEMDDIERARTYYEKAISMEPDNEVLSEKMSRIGLKKDD